MIKMKKGLVGVMVLSLSYVGCSEQTSHEEATDNSQNKTSSAIELNNGEKWAINDEMMNPVKDMEAHIVEFSSDELQDYLALAETLKVDIKSLTSNCTMTGQGHDELHKWLLPYIDLVSKLSEATDEGEALVQFEAIKTSLSTYNKHFK